MSDISTDAMMRESAMMDASNNHVWARKVRRLCIERDKLKAQIAALPPAPDAPAWKGNDAFCASLRNAPKNAFKHAPAPVAVPDDHTLLALMLATEEMDNVQGWFRHWTTGDRPVSAWADDPEIAGNYHDAMARLPDFKAAFLAALAAIRGGAK